LNPKRLREQEKMCTAENGGDKSIIGEGPMSKPTMRTSLRGEVRRVLPYKKGRPYRLPGGGHTAITFSGCLQSRRKKRICSGGIGKEELTLPGVGNFYVRKKKRKVCLRLWARNSIKGDKISFGRGS